MLGLQDQGPEILAARESASNGDRETGACGARLSAACGLEPIGRRALAGTEGKAGDDARSALRTLRPFASRSRTEGLHGEPSGRRAEGGIEGVVAAP